MWIKTIDKNGKIWSFNSIKLQLIREDSLTEIRFRYDSGSGYADVTYDNKEKRDEELKRIIDLLTNSAILNSRGNT